MRTSLLCLLALSALISSVAAAQDSLPSWVPQNALSAAKKQWETGVTTYEAASLERDFGLNSINEALSCELRTPYKVVGIDYESYNGNANILDYLVSPQGILDSAYGFGIYYDDKRIGDLIVNYQDGAWRLLKMSGYGDEGADSVFAPIFDKYPISAEYRIYMEWDGALFVLKKDSVVAAFEFGYPEHKYQEIEPRKYVREEGARRIGARRHFHK